jgi:RNA polymerase sigma-70 factor (ECF subfamily)
LLTQLRRRDNAAAVEIFERYHRRLIGLARKQFDSRLRRKLDPEDVVQSALGTVLRRLADGECKPRDWDSLWGLLTCVTVRKCGRWRKHFGAQRRNIRREAPPQSAAEDSHASWEFPGRGPGPEDVAVLEETLEWVMRALNDREQQVITLHLQGSSAAEISRELGCTEAKVYRVLKLVRRRLERLRDGRDSEPDKAG